MRNLTRRGAPGPHNPLCYWATFVSPLRVVWNFLIIFLCRYLPSLRLKRFLYRLVGIKIGRHVSVGLMVMFDIFFPQLITIGDNSVIGYNSVILAHEFLVKDWSTGPVVIGANVLIGANSTVLPGVTIGDDACISAMTLVNKDVMPHTFAGGVPVRVLSGQATPHEQH